MKVKLVFIKYTRRLKKHFKLGEELEESLYSYESYGSECSDKKEDKEMNKEKSYKKDLINKIPELKRVKP